MKVILLRDVRGLGVHHTVKEVSDGYAINFLFPQKLAEVATEERLKRLAEQKEAQEVQMRAQEVALDAAIASAEGKTISLTARASEKGGLFKALTAKDVTHALKEQYDLLLPEEVVHSDPIKMVGEHPIVLQGKHKKANLTFSVKAA